MSLKYLNKCREEIAGALQESYNRWRKREHVVSNTLNAWKLNIFNINIDGRILLQQFPLKSAVSSENNGHN